MNSVFLKKGREASLLRRHPWVFSGAIARVEGSPEAGELVRVLDQRGQFLGVGAISPRSQIRVRLFAFEDIDIDRSFLRDKLQQAIHKRQAILDRQDRDACRLVYAEADGLPGLIVDYYAGHAVLQCSFAGMEPHKAVIAQLLQETLDCKSVYERSDSPLRSKEGLDSVAGEMIGQAPPADLVIRERDMLMAVDVRQGHKTGYYLDQCDNRQRVASHSVGKRVLNCFAYTGAFSVAALQAGASHVTSVDSSESSLRLAQTNVQRNGLDNDRHDTVEANVFELLRHYQHDSQDFDVIILDPPKLADNKSKVVKAARAYKDLALQAARILPPGGLLISFSCSGAIDMNLFQKITADACLDAGRSGQVIQYLHQAADHPVSLAFPESQYLKGLICRID